MKKAFALAETLITLLIIGIIAAILIYPFCAKYQKLQTETKLKKVYSNLEQAIELTKIEYGDPINWDWSEGYSNNALGGKTPLKIVNIIKPHLNIAKDCKEGVYKTGKCLCNVKLDNTARKIAYNYLLSDNVFLSFNAGGYSWSDDPWVWITVDINGKNKPNVYGKDIFNLFFYAKKGFSSARWVSWHSPCYNRKNRDEAIKNCKTNYISTCCFDLIKDNGWKIPEDYPW